jgi:hypothetical protein
MSIILQLARRMKETNDKLLVFTNLLFTYSTIKDMLTSNKISFVGFSGEDAVTVRNEQVKQFQAPNSKVTVFLATMRVRDTSLSPLTHLPNCTRHPDGWAWTKSHCRKPRNSGRL